MLLMFVFVSTEGFLESEEKILVRLREILDLNKQELINAAIRRITFMFGFKDGSYPKYYTFNGPNYNENENTVTLNRLWPSNWN
nr:CMF_HP1_G0048250.mRNA.1.CDS.1 [Saccharomyces cerevisiae]